MKEDRDRFIPGQPTAARETLFVLLCVSIFFYFGAACATGEARAMMIHFAGRDLRGLSSSYMRRTRRGTCDPPSETDFFKGGEIEGERKGPLEPFTRAAHITPGSRKPPLDFNGTNVARLVPSRKRNCGFAKFTERVTSLSPV